MENDIRLQGLAYTRVKDARPLPENKFSNGSSVQFLGMMANFHALVDVPGMDSRSKINELSHWFVGPAGTVINAHATMKDADTAYATILSLLDNLLGQNSDAAMPLLKQVSMGKKIEKGDYEAHLQLFADITQSDRREDRPRIGIGQERRHHGHSQEQDSSSP